MTDSQSSAPHPANAARDAEVMDQALTWLIELEIADAAQEARFQAWLDADPVHRQAFARAEALWNSQPLQDAARHLVTPEKPTARRRAKRHWLPVAAAALVLLGLFNFSDLPLRLRADHLTVAGERQRLELADGSKVLLNTRSAFSSRSASKADSQQVASLLQGEAFFEVPANKGLPLEVDAGPVRMSASSTAFAVRYLDGVTQIRVQRGALSVQALRGDAQMKLGAGDSLRIGPEGFGQREKSDPSKDLAWVQGRLIVENCPLGDVLAELRRYYPGWIVSTNSQLDQVAVTGNYRLDSPVDIMRSLAHITSSSLHELPALMILN